MKRSTLLSILLALIMIFSCVGVCAETDSGIAKDGSLPITTEDLTLTMYVTFASGGRQIMNTMAEHDVMKVMMEETGINIDFIHPPLNDDGTFFTTMIASGDIPDLIYNNFETYPGGATGAMDDGVIIDATPIIDEYAYYFNQMLDSIEPINRVRVKSDDGRYVLFGTAFGCEYTKGQPGSGFIARKDILDKYGITELPETFDEYEEMFEAFKSEGITPVMFSFGDSRMSSVSPVATAFDLTWNTVSVIDDKLIYSRTEPEYKQVLEILADWYAKGYLTSDSLSATTSDYIQAFRAGTVGAVLTAQWEIITLESVGQATVDGFEIVCLPHPRQEKGDEIMTYAGIGSGGPSTDHAYFVSATCEHPIEAIRFIDYIYKPEVLRMTAWGVNTEEHTLWVEDEEGHRNWTDFMINNPDFDYQMGRERYTINEMQGQWDNEMEMKQYGIPEVQQAWDVWKRNTTSDGRTPAYMTQTTDEAQEIAMLKTQIDTYGDEMVLKFITGQASLDEFDSFVETLKSLGTDRLVELYQAAYDRYLAR